MTHAQYKTRLCTCEHALSRTPTRAIHQAYARSQGSPSPHPSPRFSSSSSSFVSMHEAYTRRWRLEVTESGTDHFSGIRIGLSISLRPPSLHGNSTKTTRFFPAAVPLRAPLSSCACFDHPSFRDDFSGHFVKGRNEGVSTVFRWGNVFDFF